MTTNNTAKTTQEKPLMTPETIDWLANNPQETREVCGYAIPIHSTDFGAVNAGFLPASAIFARCVSASNPKEEKIMNKQKTELKTFDFQGNPLKVLIDGNNEPWFIAKEVADILEYSDAHKMTSKLDDDEVQNRQIGGFGNRGVNVINESGLYSAVITSQKPEAKKFKKWLTSEVLPTIRKTGGYSLATKPTATPQDHFYKSHKTACLLFPDRLGRLRYANALTLEQTGVDVLSHAGVRLPEQNHALNTLLNKTIDDRTIQQLLDAVHHQHLDRANAQQILRGLFIKLNKGILYLARKCPLVDDHAALKTVSGAITNVPVFFKGHGTCRATVITLY